MGRLIRMERNDEYCSGDSLGDGDGDGDGDCHGDNRVGKQSSYCRHVEDLTVCVR